MRICRSLLLAVCAAGVGLVAPAPGQAAPSSSTEIERLLKYVEERYNKARTLRVSFEESYSAPGRPPRVESGDLVLRKPGKMRWTYFQPPGKLFLSDGRFLYYYHAQANRVEKMKLEEAGDMRAPLAFLLGKLTFQTDFRNFQVRTEGSDTVIRAETKSDRLPYRVVEFTVTPVFEIRRLNVIGQDSSELRFQFTNERLNVPVEDKQFRFQTPAGATYVDLTRGEASPAAAPAGETAPAPPEAAPPKER